MKAIMLRHNALNIRCESKFEEEWLEPIIKALEKGEGFDIFTLSNTVMDSTATGYGFMTIELEVDLPGQPK